MNFRHIFKAERKDGEEKSLVNTKRPVTEKQHLVYLDIIKILAIFMVLYNHRATFLLCPERDMLTLHDLLFQMMAVLCRCAVPLFFMCSGAVLMQKQENYAELLRKRVLRIVAVMVLCTLIRYRVMYETESLGDIFLFRLNWYLYAYFSYLLMLPFLRSIAQNTSPDRAVLFLVMVFVFNTARGLILYFRVLTFLFSYASIFTTDVPSISWVIFFPLAGYFLNRDGARFTGVRLLCLIVLGALVLLLSAFLVILDYQQRFGEHAGLLRDFFITAPSCLIFVFARNHLSLDPKKYPRICRLLSELAGLTFGIFIIETHGHSILQINFILTQVPLLSSCSEYWLGWISVFVQFIFCGTVTAAAKRIPGIRKLL